MPKYQRLPLAKLLPSEKPGEESNSGFELLRLCACNALKTTFPTKKLKHRCLKSFFIIM